MAHSLEAEAGVADSLSMDDAAAAFEDDFDDAPVEETEAEEFDEFEDEPEEGEEPDDEDSEEEIDEDDEPEEAIEAPVSLNKTEKEAYAQLPKEAQQFVSQLEARRASQVQEATTKASQAQRDAEQRAAAADAEAKQIYAKQLDQVLETIRPQAPDPRLASQDPARYIAAKAQYDADLAQFAQYEQQVKSLSEEATQALDKGFYEQRERELMAIPEIANEETRQGYLDKAMGAAKKLGYDVSELTQTMDASDVKRLAEVADAFEKAEKYDAAMSRKMKRVRAGKQRTLKPGTAQQQRSGDRRSQKVNDNFRANPSNMKAAAEAFEDI